MYQVFCEPLKSCSQRKPADAIMPQGLYSKASVFWYTFPIHFCLQCVVIENKSSPPCLSLPISTHECHGHFLKGYSLPQVVFHILKHFLCITAYSKIVYIILKISSSLMMEGRILKFDICNYVCLTFKFIEFWIQHKILWKHTLFLFSGGGYYSFNLKIFKSFLL